jgi:hypothetical protein
VSASAALKEFLAIALFTGGMISPGPNLWPSKVQIRNMTGALGNPPTASRGNGVSRKSFCVVAANLIAFGFVGLTPLVAQLTSTVVAPAFEVASVKRSDPSERVIGLWTWPGGRITVKNYTLKMLIEAAYEIQEFQIAGGPKWTGDERYSIVAKPPADSKSSTIRPQFAKLPPPKRNCR